MVVHEATKLRVDAVGRGLGLRHSFNDNNSNDQDIFDGLFLCSSVISFPLYVHSEAFELFFITAQPHQQLDLLVIQHTTF
jgi:hypothetical protein